MKLDAKVICRLTDPKLLSKKTFLKPLAFIFLIKQANCFLQVLSLNFYLNNVWIHKLIHHFFVFKIGFYGQQNRFFRYGRQEWLFLDIFKTLPKRETFVLSATTFY